jgi:hypothetical protein
MWLSLALSFLVSPIAAADPTVTVLNGTYSGLYLPTFNQDLFLGVPYAQDTGGQNRFLVPQALNETWTDVRSAKQYGNSCPDNTPAADAVYGMSENCLSINVIRPAGLEESQKLPVVLWIHGGRLVFIVFAHCPLGHSHCNMSRGLIFPSLILELLEFIIYFISIHFPPDLFF